MKKRFLLTLLTGVFMGLLALQAQQAQPWTKSAMLSEHKNLRKGVQVSTYRLDKALLREELSKTDNRNLKNGSARQGSAISFPSPEGNPETYRIVRTSVLSEGLSKKFPEIQSYKGISTEHPGRSIYFSVDKTGFHGMIYEKGRSWYLNPETTGSSQVYLAAKAALSPSDYQCKVEDQIVKQAARESQVLLRSFDDSVLRTFRLALAATAEYSIYHINQANLSNGTETQKKEAVLAAMNTTMTRVNGIFENDLAITMELIENNEEIIFLDPETDGLTNDDGSALLNEIQDIIDNAIGFDNYDIGHVFSTGGGGIALVSSPCTPNKAKGVTGLNIPEGDPFDIDFVAHEMGHQLGATHTFNNSCGGNRTDISAVEPGSGSTIMAYAGICPPDVVGQSDDYFHALSIQQIWSNITIGNSNCAATTTLANNAPVLSTSLDYTIPAGTPFVLEAVATDADGDLLTYSWEQQDNEITQQPPQSTATEGPLFRSFPPSESPNRYFPNPGLLSNNLSPQWGPLPTVSRRLNFSILVRDNNSAGGQTTRGDSQIQVIETATPFSVTSQSTTQTLEAGQVETISWEVGETNLEPINTGFVDLLLIVDNNLDNPVIIEENTPNDGSQDVVIPSGITTSNARIMVRAVDNIFFALNKEALRVEQSGYALDLPSLEYNICQPDNLVLPFTYLTYAGFNETTTFSATDISPGLSVAFSQTTATANDTAIEVTVSGTSSATAGANGFTLIATSSGDLVKTYPISINIFNDTFEALQLLNPANNSSNLLLDTTLNWEATPNTASYQVDLSTDAGFTNIIETASVTNPIFNPENLEGGTTYYWRVKPINDCGEGNFSQTFNFTTIVINAANYENSTVIPIPEKGTPVVNSTIFVDKEGDLNKLSVGVDISHSYVQDLTITLTSPNGRRVTLLSLPCGEENDIDVIFDDEGDNLTCGTNPAISGVVIPKEALAAFKGEPILGPWTLTVSDGYDLDGGSLNKFSLEILVNGAFKEDQDRDGVFDENDLCPNTPADTKVDVTGCPIFSLPVANYLIQTEGESCRNREDGQVAITTAENQNYTARITGNGISETASFNTTASFNSLASGNYQLCFTVEGQPDYEQCFEITIEEPEALSVLSKPDEQTRQLKLDLSGAELYFIDLNGTLITTEDGVIDLPLREGLNLLEVSTSKACQGVYKEEILIGEVFLVYPNPVNTNLFIHTMEQNTTLELNIYSVTGQRIWNQSAVTNATGKAEVNVSELPNGVYLLEIDGTSTNKTIKLVKR
ncbi:reprolysin-like metallopeptidase [Robertkochia flava]|uniref:reprolysin-like metallopeptidase n=1 Tax=Robertkochia flava TaxID=3447986 RepID=UPI001CCFB2AF|nr:zinc-dependent metalloprotease family protein [Robertkochia marina]